MLGGIGCAGVMACSSTAKIDVLSVVTLGIRRKQKRFRSSEWKGHTERDQREVTVEQHRTVDACERSELLGDPFGLGQKCVAQKAAERQVSPSTFTRRIHALRATQAPRQSQQRGH